MKKNVVQMVVKVLMTLLLCVTQILVLLLIEHEHVSCGCVLPAKIA
jgi:hypothetical protein